MTRRYPDVLQPEGTYPPTEDMLAEPVPQEVQEAQKNACVRLGKRRKAGATGRR